MTAPVSKFNELLIAKKIAVNHSDIMRLLRETIPDETICSDGIRFSQFMKVFARSILSGAILNIFMYVRQLVRFEMGRVTDQGQQLKVLKY